MNKFGAYGFVLLFGACAIAALTLAYNQRQRLDEIEARYESLKARVDADEHDIGRGEIAGMKDFNALSGRIDAIERRLPAPASSR